MKTMVFLIGFLMFLTSCNPVGETKSINDVDQVDFTSGENVLLDVRTPEEFNAGNLPNSININLNSSDFDSKIKKLDPSKTYYVYCKSGNRSTKAVNKMNKMSFKHIVHLNDGYDNYEK
ncbi:MAG: rhodanese-like domain-containing protein [Weeksellaceae bacterium]